MSSRLITSRSLGAPLLHPRALANGTLPSVDLTASRRFYQEVLGLEVIDKPPEGLLIRLGGEHTYLVEPVGDLPTRMVLLNHNGFYLHENQPVEEAYKKLLAVKDAYGIRLITKPNWQHGYFAFFLQDHDGNWWEFHHAPDGQRADLTQSPQLSPDQARNWFMARRHNTAQAPRGVREAASESDASSRDMLSRQSSPAVVATKVLSHGTLESLDLQATRRFYEEVLGLNVRQLTPVSIHIDLGDGYLYAAVHAPNAARHMPAYYRNTLLFASKEEIDDAYDKVSQVRDQYGVMEVATPQHGSDRYFFRVRDLDGNLWELAYDVNGGYHNAFQATARARI